jgi:hypothetical protein
MQAGLSRSYYHLTEVIFMNAPGKGILKVVSILFIIFGVIATIISLLALLGSAVLTAYTAELGAIFMIATILMILASALELILGIAGLKKCNDPAQAGFFINCGIILCALTLISLVMNAVSTGFSLTGLIGFALPILYIVGGIMNKKASAQDSQLNIQQ